MLFNSFDFLIFILIALTLFFGINHFVPLKCRRVVSNLYLLGLSYYFYMSWKCEYALILLAITITTYLCALGIEKCDHKKWKKPFVAISIVVSMSFLLVFKYYGFAMDNLGMLASFMGFKLSPVELDLILPIGLSFFTFQSISYVVDVYRKKVNAERNFFTYALYLSFFPQLVAGPIERSYTLLPQFRELPKFDSKKALRGLNLMLCGYFIKLVLADHCSEYVDAIFNNYEMHNGGSYLVASLLFFFQIYGDFSGYSLIAIGCAGIMGYDLMQNFRQPMFATSVSNFWRRWHISLTTWFKDYVYIPLGGSRCGRRTYFNLFIVFLLSGLWHGANWTFVCWGALNGMYLCIERFMGWSKKDWTGVARLCHWFMTFVLVMLAFAFFRAQTVAQAVYMMKGIVTNPGMPYFSPILMAYIALGVAGLLARDYKEEKGLEFAPYDSPRLAYRCAYFIGMATFILLFGTLNGNTFIYFQF